MLCVGLRLLLCNGYFADLRSCGGYFVDRRPQLGPQNTHWLVRRSASPQNTRGLRSRERKVHRENFRSRRTFVPWNIRSRGAKSPRTFVPWNLRTRGTFAPQTTFVHFNFRSCGTFAAVLNKVVESRKALFP